jgi:hypothetical protein
VLIINLNRCKNIISFFKKNNILSIYCEFNQKNISLFLTMISFAKLYLANDKTCRFLYENDDKNQIKVGWLIIFNNKSKERG